MACGRVRVAWCGFWGVVLGYGGYGLRPIARGPVWVLGRCPQATVVMACGQLRVARRGAGAALRSDAAAFCPGLFGCSSFRTRDLP